MNTPPQIMAMAKLVGELRARSNDLFDSVEETNKKIRALVADIDKFEKYLSTVPMSNTNGQYQV